jgi:hypothetical protein
LNSNITNDLYDKIQSSIPEILHCKRWNNQVKNIEKEYFFPTPAIFIEYKDSSIIISNSYNRIIEFTVSIHLIYNSSLYEDLSILDLKQKVFTKLQGYSTSNFSSLQSIDEQDDLEHDQLYEIILDFKSSFSDIISDNTSSIHITSIDLDVEIDDNDE